MEDRVYQSFVYSVKIDIEDNEVCGQNKFLQLDLFDNLLYGQPTDEFVPIIGTVRGSNDLCYGVRCSENTMCFKIYDEQTQEIFVAYLVGKIAGIIKIYSPKFCIGKKKYSYFNIVQSEVVMCQITNNMVKKLFSNYNLDHPKNRMEAHLAYEIANREYSLPSYAISLKWIEKSIYYNIVINFLNKNNIDDISVLTDNEKTIKLYEKYKKRNNYFGANNANKTNKMFNEISSFEWFKMSKKVKDLLPYYKVFDEIEETSLDMFKFNFLENNNIRCVDF